MRHHIFSNHALSSEEVAQKLDEEKFKEITEGTFFSAYLRSDEEKSEPSLKRYFIVTGIIQPFWGKLLYIVEINKDSILRIFQRGEPFGKHDLLLSLYRIEGIEIIELNKDHGQGEVGVKAHLK